MHDRYDESDDPLLDGLDEYLCEYVDGTMDPAVRASFEDYMAQNPPVAAHVRELQDLRQALCRYGCRIQAPVGMHYRLRCRLQREDLDGTSTPVTERLTTFAAWTSLLVCVVALGITLGAALPESPATPDSETVAVTPQPLIVTPLAPVRSAPAMRPAIAPRSRYQHTHPTFATRDTVAQFGFASQRSYAAP
ncbi:MAG: hypothetical protein RhofKO_36820 [Rhodothermales bacterium]